MRPSSKVWFISFSLVSFNYLGYVGPSCSHVCDTNPCLNGGQCVENEESMRGYTCICNQETFTGNLLKSCLPLFVRKWSWFFTIWIIFAQANTVKSLLNKGVQWAGGEIPCVAHVTVRLNVDIIQIVIKLPENVIVKWVFGSVILQSYCVIGSPLNPTFSLFAGRSL